MRQKKKKNPGEQERKSFRGNWRQRNLGGASGKETACQCRRCKMM